MDHQEKQQGWRGAGLDGMKTEEEPSQEAVEGPAWHHRAQGRRRFVTGQVAIGVTHQEIKTSTALSTRKRVSSVRRALGRWERVNRRRVETSFQEVAVSKERGDSSRWSCVDFRVHAKGWTLNKLHVERARWKTWKRGAGP